jgi:lysophospholipase L1-like esterase
MKHRRTSARDSQIRVGSGFSGLHKNVLLRFSRVSPRGTRAPLRQRILDSLLPALALSALLVIGVALQPAAATTSHKLKAGDLYVSLGSSIASGYGISVQSTTCGRSSRDYGQLVAAHLRLHLVDASCGAATIPNVVDTPQGSNPPQLTSVTPATKLVTVAVGGNDIDYNATAVACDDPATCAAPPNLAALVANMRIALKALIEKIKAAAPSATIVFVTYPREVPAGINCPALGFTNAGAALVRSMGQMLENAFVQVVKPLGVVFVDPYAVPGDHTVCAPPSQQWTQGAQYTFGTTGFAHHPTALGHKVMAQMIVKALHR